jgi:predicted ArsR family transcriptional regulator
MRSDATVRKDREELHRMVLRKPNTTCLQLANLLETPMKRIQADMKYLVAVGRVTRKYRFYTAVQGEMK